MNRRESQNPSVLALRGRGLRFVLVDEIRRRRSMTIAEMAELLASHGYELAGRPSKVISDALRWEVARGRIKRVGRGIYTYGQVPKTTARRIRVFAERCELWIVAVMRHEATPQTPPTRPDRVQPFWKRAEDPSRPPWQSLGWLWTT